MKAASKLAILEEIRALMDEQTDGRISSKRKPSAVEISVTSSKLDRDDEPDADLDSRLRDKAASKGDDCGHEDDEDEDGDLKERLMEMYEKLGKS